MMLKYFLYLSDTVENNTDKAVKAMMIYACNIFCESEQTDEQGNTVKLWQYDEAKVTRQEYLQNCIDDNAQALADLAAMIGG